MINFSQVSIAGLTAASLGFVGATMPTGGAQAAQRFTAEARSQSTRIAQADNCRQVSSGVAALNVRRAPSLTAGVVGTVLGGRNVTIENLGADGWAPISAPLEGYVSTNYLTLCDAVSEPTVAPANTRKEGDLCREVVVRSGLNVRSEPDRYSNRLTALPTGTTVQIAEPETEHWVFITEPVDGYVAKRFLGACY